MDEKWLSGFNDRLPGIIDSACVFSSSFLRIVSRTSNMPFILVLSLRYVKYFQYHHITAGRQAGLKGRSPEMFSIWPNVCFYFWISLIFVWPNQNLLYSRYWIHFCLYSFLFAIVEILKMAYAFLLNL